MERNVELFHDIAEHIEKYPEKHQQDTFCGSSMCVGGWAMVLSGKYILKEIWDSRYGSDIVDFVDIETGMAVDKSVNEILECANLLGISEHEMDIIYNKIGEVPHGLTWPEALYKIAGGADVYDTLYG